MYINNSNYSPNFQGKGLLNLYKMNGREEKFLSSVSFKTTLEEDKLLINSVGEQLNSFTAGYLRTDNNGCAKFLNAVEKFTKIKIPRGGNPVISKYPFNKELGYFDSTSLKPDGHEYATVLIQDIDL